MAEPEGAVALKLAEWASTAKAALIYIARSDTRANRLAAAIAGSAPRVTVLHLPPWDSLPYERISPSPVAMGRRMAVLNRLRDGAARPLVLVASVEAAAQRLPPRTALRESTFRLRPGEPIALAALEDFLSRTGYTLVEQVESAGEAAIRGEVVDIYPAAATQPARVSHSAGRIDGIRQYDPVSQRSTADADELLLEPASELLLSPGEQRNAGMEQELPRFYPCLETIFDYLPNAALAADLEMEERVASWAEQIADAYRHRSMLRRTGVTGELVPPEQLYVGEEEWNALVAQRQQPHFAAADAVPGPSFVGEPDAATAARRFLWRRREEGDRLVLTAATARQLRSLLRLAPVPATRVANWEDAEHVPVASLVVPLEAGFRRQGTTVLAAADLWGAAGTTEISSDRSLPETEIAIGDAVIHPEHGLGRLEALETVLADELAEDFLRLGYAGPTAILAPIGEIDGIRRYGSVDATVALDHAGGERWHKSRAEIEAELARSAAALTELAAARKNRSAAIIDPPRAAYRRFAAGFPYPETADQAGAIAAVLADLRSGRPMDRLICGEVGFGKTEVALRAAAAAALCGKQVAVLAPTTVLVRQHFENFRKRFARLGIEIVQLSRLASRAEASAAKRALADGSAQIVIGTHALLSKSVRFADLGLLVVDEEQRFGARHKQALRQLGADIHVLTLTATPIPRTLEMALVGLAEISLLATPPARRQPVRTIVRPFDPVSLREALLWEHRRGGQSFVVTPRIEDIDGLAALLAETVPGLEIMVAHARLPAAELDRIMVEFAGGSGDILLSTSIIESGLDIPAVNTMIVCRADRFGLAQLH